MKRLMLLVPGAVMLASGLVLNVYAETLPPGQVDFGTFLPPAGGGEFVEVNLTGSLISMAARFIEKQEPDVAQVLNGVQLVHVNVIGLNDTNRGDLEKRTEKVRKELESKGWERIVTVQQNEQKVGVYLKTLNKDTVQGLVVMVMDGKDNAVFVNVVGDIKPEKLALLGERLHIDPLKKIGRVTEKAEKAEKTEEAESGK
jgi:Na+-translocating ferredoxin:NAD+ oxidoreductase RnfG subunit